jgi:hypothetical protein
MRNFLEIGQTPPMEPCTQVGHDVYKLRAMEEMRQYIQLIIRTVGIPPPKARLAIKWFPHDFGRYGEVVCWYEEDDEESRSYALHVESNGPQNWQGEGASRWEKQA